LFEEYKPLFVSLLSSEIVEPAYMDAVNALVSFDGTYHKGDVAPALFEVVRFMSTQITTPEGGSPTFVPHAPPTLMLNGDSICALSAPFTDCNGYLYKLVKDATNLLMQNHGKLPQWGVDGNVGKLLAKNVPLSSIPTYAAASTIVTGPTGGTHTLNVAQPIVDAKASLHTEFGPSIRTLHLGKEKGTLLLSFPGGNSEFPTSPYYQNFAPFYQNGTYVPLSTDNYQAVDSALLI
jgi:acyl-homoserine lactone acylase PvdQ